MLRSADRQVTIGFPIRRMQCLVIVGIAGNALALDMLFGAIRVRISVDIDIVLNVYV